MSSWTNPLGLLVLKQLLAFICWIVERWVVSGQVLVGGWDPERWAAEGNYNWHYTLSPSEWFCIKMCSNESHFHVPLIVRGKVATSINVSLIFWNQSLPSFVFFLRPFLLLFFQETTFLCFLLLLTDQVKYALKHAVFGPQLLLLYPIIS